MQMKLADIQVQASLLPWLVGSWAFSKSGMHNVKECVVEGIYSYSSTRMLDLVKNMLVRN